MARTLAEIDAALATVETRITQLVNAGQNLRADVDALSARGDNIHDDVAQLQAQMQVVKDVGEETVPLLRKIKKQLGRARAGVTVKTLTETVMVRGRIVRRAIKQPPQPTGAQRALRK